MAAGESLDDEDVCTLPQKSKREGRACLEDGKEPSYTDYLCPICLQILIEPVVMPCTHELCKPCFKQNVEEASLQCPLCRQRISSWARKQARAGTLVNRKRWEQIKRLFPERCAKRLRGEDDDDDWEGHPPTKRVLSSAGELFKEYELEMNKIRQAREEEMRASEEVIRKLEEEEKMLKQQAEQQAKQDEELARQIQQEQQQNVSNSQEQQKSSQENTMGSDVNKLASSRSKKTSQKQGTYNTVTLDRWFSPISKNNNPPRNPRSTQLGQEESDHELASKLQRQFDMEARKQQEMEEKRRKDKAYDLRSKLSD